MIRYPAKSSAYYLPKHRYLTVMHYALQYQEWKDERNAIGDDGAGLQIDPQPRSGKIGDPTATKAMKRAELYDKIKLIETTVEEVAPEISAWLLKAVTTEKITYVYLREVMNIPCGRNYYYDKRRQFYYRLSQKMK